MIKDRLLFWLYYIMYAPVWIIYAIMIYQFYPNPSPVQGLAFYECVGCVWAFIVLYYLAMAEADIWQDADLKALLEAIENKEKGGER